MQLEKNKMRGTERFSIDNTKNINPYPRVNPTQARPAASTDQFPATRDTKTYTYLLSTI